MQFGSDLDSETQKTLGRGAKLTDTLKQRQYLNYSVKEMIVLLVVSQSDLIDAIPAKRVSEFNEGLLDYFRINKAELLSSLDPDAALSDDARAGILSAAQEYMKITLGDEGGGSDV